jgi:DNA polymerase I-like protein with 3'-5' exonuclease and polymerase domains
LKKLVPELLGVELPSFADVTMGRGFDMLDPSDYETMRYACADSDYALRLYHLFNSSFDTFMPKHRKIVEQLESPTAVYCGIMHYNGLLVDEPLMNKTREYCVDERQKAKEAIAAIIGNVEIGENASTKAFKDYLFKTLKLPAIKVTAKNNAAADDEALIQMSEYCAKKCPELVPLFKHVRAYRAWGKIISTYSVGYVKYINPATGRIHPDLLPLATETGRFAARNPNCQNCFDPETEILTTRGFIPFPSLEKSDAVAQWDNGEVSFVLPESIVVNEHQGEMIHLQNQHIDLCVTPDHRCLLKNRRSKQLIVVRADGYYEDYLQVHAGQYCFGSKSLSHGEVVLLVATQADGYYHGGGIEFTFAKARKYRRMIQALKEVDAPYIDNVKADGLVRIRLLSSPVTAWIMDVLGNPKVWGSMLLSYDRHTIKAILAEINHWDGCFTRGSMYSSSIKENADWLQILYVLTGSRAKERIYHNGNPNSVPNYQLDVVERDYSLTTNIDKTTFQYAGKVYCVSVPSGFIVVRRNGKVCVTGNCPQFDNDPAGVRNFIMASPGNILVSLDFSQIELRVGAFFCRDEIMLAVYRTGGDIHAATTAVIYRIPLEEAMDKSHPDYKERRTIAKSTNFGTFYGLFPNGLLRSLHFKAGLDISLNQCADIINNLKAGYPKIAEWQENIKDDARAKKYVETQLGRRRFVPNIDSEEWSKRTFSERVAMNSPIQGTAADILKLALGRIIEGLPARPWIKPLLQIHDELLFEVQEDRVEDAISFIKSCMEAQPFEGFDVPIVAEAAVGYRFGEMK